MTSGASAVFGLLVALVFTVAFAIGAIVKRRRQRQATMISEEPAIPITAEVRVWVGGQSARKYPYSVIGHYGTGTCLICGKRLEPGQPITRTAEDEPWVHATCVQERYREQGDHSTADAIRDDVARKVAAYNPVRTVPAPAYHEPPSHLYEGAPPDLSCSFCRLPIRVGDVLTGRGSDVGHAECVASDHEINGRTDLAEKIREDALLLSNPPVTKCDWRQTCQLCDRTIARGATVGFYHVMREWVHVGCLTLQYKRDGMPAIAQAVKEQAEMLSRIR